MIKYKIHYLLTIFLTFTLLYGCSKIRKSAGVSRKSPDEFQVIENPPLVIPPNYNLVPPDQLQEKNIENIEKELAEEILFGLGETNIEEEHQLPTMNQILSEANVGEVSDTIRNEIDEDFAKEMKIEDESQFKTEYEKEVLDAVIESEKIREKNFSNDSIEGEDIPIKIQKVKKKKRFFIFNSVEGEDTPIKEQKVKKKKRFFIF